MLNKEQEDEEPASRRNEDDSSNTAGIKKCIYSFQVTLLQLLKPVTICFVNRLYRIAGVIRIHFYKTCSIV
jgi:hypothetical protein